MSVSNQQPPEQQGSIKPASANQSPNKSPSFPGTNNSANNNSTNNTYLNVPNRTNNFNNSSNNLNNNNSKNNNININNSPNAFNKNNHTDNKNNNTYHSPNTSNTHNNHTENNNNHNNLTTFNNNKRSPNKSSVSDNLGNSSTLPNAKSNVDSNAPRHASPNPTSNSTSDPGHLGSHSNPIPVEDGGKSTKKKRARRSHKKFRNAKLGNFQNQPTLHSSADAQNAGDQPPSHKRPQATLPNQPPCQPQNAEQSREASHKRPRITPPNHQPTHPQNARDQSYNSSYGRHQRPPPSQAPPSNPQSPPLPSVHHFPSAFPNSPPLPNQAPLFHPPHSPLFQPPQPSHSPLFQPPHSPSVRPNSPPLPLPRPLHFTPNFDRNTPELSLNAPKSFAHAQDRAHQPPPHQPYPVPTQNPYKQKRDFYHNRPPSGDYQPRNKMLRTAEFSPPIHLPAYPPSPSYSPAFTPPYQYTPAHSPLPTPPYPAYNHTTPPNFDNPPRSHWSHRNNNASPPNSHNTSPPTSQPHNTSPPTNQSHNTSPPTSQSHNTSTPTSQSHNTSPPTSHPPQSHDTHPPPPHTQHQNTSTHEKPRDRPRNPTHRNTKFLHNKPINNKHFNNRNKNPQFKKDRNFKNNSKHNSQRNNNNNKKSNPGKNTALSQELPTSPTQLEAVVSEQHDSLHIHTSSTEITATYTSTITTTTITSTPSPPTDISTNVSTTHEINLPPTLPTPSIDDPIRSSFGNNISPDLPDQIPQISSISLHSFNPIAQIDPPNHTSQTSHNDPPPSHTTLSNHTTPDQNFSLIHDAPRNNKPDQNISQSHNAPLNHNTCDTPLNLNMRNTLPNHNAHEAPPNHNKPLDHHQQINDTSSNSSTEFSLPVQPANFKKRKSVSYEATATNSLRAKYGPNTIYICNLPHLPIPDLENKLRSFFSTFGNITFLRVTPQGKEGKGTAYVTFENHLAVENAMKETLKIEGRYASMKDLDTGQVQSHLDPAHRGAIQAITRELFVKLNHRENIHKLFRLDNVCYGISYTGENGKLQKASAIIRDTYGSLGLYLLAEPFNEIFVVNDKTRTIECNHSLSLSQVEAIIKNL